VTDLPQTQYAKRGDVRLAYQALGEGPPDLVLIPGWATHVEAMWDERFLARFLTRLSSFSRLILFDKRGVGLSDPVPMPVLPTVEEWMDDVDIVMEAAGSQRAALVAADQAGPMAILFAATYPDRLSALVLVNSSARTVRAPDYPIGVPEVVVQAYIDTLEENWAREGVALEVSAPSVADDEEFRRWAGRYQRQTVSLGMMLAMTKVIPFMDARHALPTISVPTLIVHRADDQYFLVDHSRYLAEHIPNARLIELPGADHLFWVGDADPMLAEIQEFVTGERPTDIDVDRVLATVLFTDIVGSTEHTADAGDRAWRDLLDRHDAMVRRQLERFGGREVNTTGDGFLATFDGPARAIRCATAIRDGARQIGMEIRAGLHTGEIERRGSDVAGIAVSIATRVMTAATGGEVLVSRTVTDLVAGSGIAFDDRGEHELKGVPGRWALYAVGT
jgi:pimeloyl-ACP methyl ester carboxylesterase